MAREAPSRYRHLVTLSELHAKLSSSGHAASDAAHAEAARAYALLAWRSPDARVSAQGRSIFGERYPFGPEFEKAAGMLEPAARLVKVNTEVAQNLAQRFNIRSIPTMALFRGGREIARQSGAMGATAIAIWVRANA